MIIMCVVICIDFENLTPTYESSEILWSVCRTEEIQRIHSKSVWFGRGDHYYTYPDYKNLLREHNVDSELNRKVTDIEHTRAYFGFGCWRNETLLPVLTYCFGKWVGVLYTAIVLLWFIGSSAGFARVKGIGGKILYGNCMSLVGIQLAMTLMDYYGIAACPMPLVFSTVD